MKLSSRQIRMMYSHLEDPDMDEDFWPMMGVLTIIVAVWTGIIHLMDWLTFDVIPWWVEPFTIAPLILLVIMKEVYDSINPLHWWPMFWGYCVRLPDEDRVKIYPLDSEALFKKYGGRINIHIVDYEHIKFRRRRDAVMFGLMNF